MFDSHDVALAEFDVGGIALRRSIRRVIVVLRLR